MNQIEELYNKYSKQIFNYFFYMTGDADRSNDLTQETFYQVILSIPRFKEKCKVSTWIYSIARNVFLKSLRKSRIKQVEFNEAISNEPNQMNCYSVDELVEKKETLKSIAMAINRLPEKYATVLVLRDREGLSYSEIAGITRMSESSVKVSLFRARQKFREEFKKIEKGEVYG